MMHTIWMLCRLDPAWGVLLGAVVLAVPVIVIGAASAFFPIEVDELGEETA